MSGIKSKINKHAKRQETWAINEAKESSESNPEVTQMLELAEKDIRTFL